jgi:hypothetical protein
VFLEARTLLLRLIYTSRLLASMGVSRVEEKVVYITLDTFAEMKHRNPHLGCS